LYVGVLLVGEEICDGCCDERVRCAATVEEFVCDTPLVSKVKDERPEGISIVL
jgi:hypothetical protein